MLIASRTLLNLLLEHVSVMATWAFLTLAFHKRIGGMVMTTILALRGYVSEVKDRLASMTDASETGSPLHSCTLLNPLFDLISHFIKSTKIK